jgi:hypothetical protein
MGVPNRDILNLPVTELRVSDSFKDDFASAGFNNLQDALVHSGDALVNEFGFSLHTITELITLLKQYGLESAFRD